MPSAVQILCPSVWMLGQLRNCQIECFVECKSGGRTSIKIPLPSFGRFLDGDRVELNFQRHH